MRRKKLLAMVLACSMIFGQTVWAAEPAADVTAENPAEESTAASMAEENAGEESTAGESAPETSEAAESDTETGTEAGAAEENAEVADEEQPEETSSGAEKTVKEEAAEQPKLETNVETQKVTIHYQGDDRSVEIDKSVYDNMTSARSSDESIVNWAGYTSYSVEYVGNEPQYHYYAAMNTYGRGTATVELLDEDENILARYEITVVYQEVTAYPETAAVFKPSDAGHQVDDNDPADWEVINSDPSVCQATLKFVPMDYTGRSVVAVVVLEAKKPGTTVITLNYMEGCMYEFQVNVPENAKPDDIVDFKDPMLLYALLETPLWVNGEAQPSDADRDGYLSESEMAQFDSITVGTDCGITDLTGLEYAKNASYVNFQDQSQLVNVDALFDMEKLNVINLKGTSVSVEDRFELADFQDINIVKGELQSYSSEGDIFNDPLVFETIDGDTCVREIEEYGSQYLLGIEAGEATVRISSGGQHVDIKVHVDGIPSEQPVGDDSDTGIKATGGQRILSSNGTLWEVYPETKKVKDNVSDYVSGWVYSGKDAMEYANYTDTDGTLWSDDGKLADNVVKFTGHYALNDNGVLKDIYGSQGTEISDVKTWTEYRKYAGFDEETMSSYWDSTTYVLKNDGTLWSREEVEKDAQANSFEQIASDIKDINSTGYLTEGGDYYAWSDNSKPMLTGIGDIQNIGAGMYPEFYTAADGTGYIRVSGNYVSVGKTAITDVLSYSGAYYYLTDGEELYRYSDSASQKIADNVAELSQGYANSDQYYKTNTGEYRRLPDGSRGTADDPIVIYVSGQYSLYDKGVKDDYELMKNDVVLLNHVKTAFRIGSGTTYALRTDATVWNVAEIPEQILDLDMTVKLGDLDGDGDVTISDLRLTLRAVCKKVTLTSEQKLAADVEKDGTVNIQDLRKILRFVCKKIDSLD